MTKPAGNYITDRSKAIRLLWVWLFYVFVLNFVLFSFYVRLIYLV